MLDECTRHDSSCLCEVTARTLERIMAIAAKTGRTPPHSVLVVSDNTVRECKNKYYILYLTNLVAHYKLKLCALLNLRKAHSHSAIDQLWGILARRIASTDKLYSPQSVIDTLLAELARPGLRSWLGADCEVHCEKLDCVRAWKGHFHTIQQVALSGGLLEDQSGNHCFIMMLRRGATPHKFGEVKGPGLGVVCVKLMAPQTYQSLCRSEWTTRASGQPQTLATW